MNVKCWLIILALASFVELRYNGNVPNEDDLGNLGLKILGTLKVSS
ncbi:MAG: hypothetical protein GYA39_03565 [Methanothrix sp.]|nr:hypothetical protein [Methanothrix sp.]